MQQAIVLFAWSIQRHEDPDLWISSSGDDVEDVKSGMSQDGLCRCLRCGGDDERTVMASAKPRTLRKRTSISRLYV
jgi:hypothetical protein